MPFQATVLNHDPYRNFKFLVKWDNKVVAAVSKVSALTKAVEAVDWRSGGDNNIGFKLPSKAKFEPITLERGLSADKEFVNWMNQVNTYIGIGGQASESKHNFRKNLLIEVYNLASEQVLGITVYHAWPTELTAVPDLDAKSNEVAIEKLKIMHEGWEVSFRADGIADPR